MDVEYADILQIRKGRDGRYHDVQDDVLCVVRQLKEIDPNLSVKWNEFGHYFTIIEKCKDGRERRVTNVNQLDQRLVEHIRKIGSESWNRELGRQIDAMDEQAARDKKHKHREKIGEVGERLHHAFRKDLGVKDQVILPRGV